MLINSPVAYACDTPKIKNGDSQYKPKWWKSDAIRSQSMQETCRSTVRKEMDTDRIL